MHERIDTSRRLLCQAACVGAGLVLLSTVPGCGDAGKQASCGIGSPGVGPADLAVGQARYIEAQQVFVCRDEGGYYSMTSSCTHVGAQVDFIDRAAGFKCPLHGSTFDFDGKALTGLAVTGGGDLPHYSVCTTDSGLLIVDKTTQVTADTRLVV